MGDPGIWGRHLFHSRRHGLLLALFLLTGLSARAQVKAFATLKPERIETGDTVALYIFVNGVNAKPKSVDFVSWTDVFPAANILGRSEWRKSGTQWVQQFKLIAFDSAKLELPPLSVLLAAGKPLTTNALTLSVFPTPGRELSDMAPMRDIYREPVLWMDYWPWAAGALSLFVLLLWYIRKKARRPKPVLAPVVLQPPPVSAREIALKKLGELEQRQLWKKGQEKEHHAELSLIVREYLEVNYGIAALESTTLEIMPLVTSSSFPNNQLALLREILNQADMVKYAQSQLPVSIHEAVLTKARQLVTPNYLKNEEKTKKPATQPPIKKPPTGRYEPL